eukprot:CAMPEP_0114232280 /NCGR_PEP_ID=MMETSP0058-20121206/4519_1 /TAXON_ID=36894 /ORGANISM="Pyramimonas parkeae, CCMP726" /LENGTH=402 /DNA_ID=CAMNT_0001343737 /DNA_START=184 /DNA_END=1392 /DNA_ORIENTATION=+
MAILRDEAFCSCRMKGGRAPSRARLAPVPAVIRSSANAAMGLVRLRVPPRRIGPLAEGAAPLARARGPAAAAASADDAPASGPGAGRGRADENALDWLETLSNGVAGLYWLWISIGAVLALTTPAVFSGVTREMFPVGLFFVLASMGFTLTRQDFVDTWRMPGAVLAGVGLQYTVMPLIGWSVARLLGLETSVAAGLMLVSCCPGGAASNVVTHVARGNVALSVVLTTCSTLASVLMTPALLWATAGSLVPLNAGALAWDVVKLVLAPVMVGVALAECVPKGPPRECLIRVMPPVSVLTSAVLASSAFASCAPLLTSSHTRALALAVAAVAATHAGGFLFGYQLSRLLGFEPSINRTVSVEVGMQNSVMALTLAVNHFPELSTQVPCAVSAVVMNIMGATRV